MKQRIIIAMLVGFILGMAIGFTAGFLVCHHYNNPIQLTKTNH